MFDTHAHLADSRFDSDRREVIENASKEGVSGIVCICSDFKELSIFQELLEKYSFIYGAVGVHPHDASFYGKLEERLYEALNQKKIVALGEIGLDYHYENSPRDVQKKVFKKQLRIAKEKNLPVIIHTRDAMKDTIDILRKERIEKGVMHCFSGTKKDMEILIDMGFYISLAGPVTFPKASNLQEIAQLVPAERLVVETDSPYLAPQPVRGKRNEPRYVKFTVQKIASLRGLSEEEVKIFTSKNAKSLFCLS